MPAWLPVNDTASKPRSWIAIATSAHEMRSPVDRSMSISRAGGCSLISLASSAACGYPASSLVIAAAADGGGGGPESSITSWLNPKMRLPSTWSA